MSDEPLAEEAGLQGATGESRQSVLDAVVSHGLCIGCGTCAGVCPAGCLAMGFTPAGEYQPHMVGECVGCGQCLRVCPFYDTPPDEDAAAAGILQHDWPLEGR